MDGVNLKPGWLNDGRSRVNTFGALPYGGDMYRQGELLSSFGSPSADSGQWGGFGRPVAAIPAAPRPAAPQRNPSSTFSRTNPPASSRPGPPANGPPRPAHTIVSAPPSWGPQQPRGGAQPAAAPPVVKATPALSGLQFGKVAPPPTAVRSSGSSSSQLKNNSSQNSQLKSASLQSKPPAATPSRAPHPVVRAPVVPSHPQQSGGEGAGEEASKRRREKLEQRRKFLEELASGKGEAEVEEVVAEGGMEAVPPPTGGEDKAKPAEPASIQEREMCKQEWDAKWRAMYGAFLDVDYVGDLSDEGVQGGEGESLLTEEELATFKAAHDGYIQKRKPKQLILSSGLFGSAAPRIAAEAEQLTSDEDSDDEEELLAVVR